MATHTPAPPPRPGRRRALRAMAGATAVCSLAWALPAAAAPYQELTWDALVPPDWDPMQSFDNLGRLAQLPDSDPRMQKMLEKLRKVWDEAPTIAALQGRRVRLPGYIVPLESGAGGIREFLLVPYFGACIHTPPPPANQIVHVRVSPPIKGFQTMSAVWVNGTLALERSPSELGVSGYSMQAARVEKYQGK